MRTLIVISKGNNQVYMILPTVFVNNNRQGIIDWLKTGFTAFGVSLENIQIEEIIITSVE